MPAGRPTDYSEELAASICGIYALCDDTGIRYIGQSKNIAKRYRQHCSIAQNRGNTKRQRWLYKLLSNGISPKLIILEETKELDEAEIRLIAKYAKSGATLTNTAKGGKTLDHCLKAKQCKPWGNSWSPVQRLLIEMKQTIKIIERYGGDDVENRVRNIESKIVRINKKVKEVGLERMNMLLWEKYGDS